ncbi:LysE family translocator [Nonomuraea sp. LPB2021202275-12-8]|uniref:LysE family translocator n=1 Tax=Nonomuraea sp. LPB2021202275-12-8 TaxID=3120159 RepID=UPI00300C42FD
MDTHLLVIFLGVDFLLIFTPGPDWLYLVARAIGQGRRAGLISVAGICSGYATHTVLAAAGLAAALQAIPGALPMVRYVGAAYLVLLAVRTLLTLRRSNLTLTDLQPASNWAVLRQSMLTALLNPKGLLLYLSLMPQFITAGTGVPIGFQLAVLGLLHVLNCGLVYALLALGAARAGRALTSTPRAARRVTAVSGTLLLAVAAVTLGSH